MASIMDAVTEAPAEHEASGADPVHAPRALLRFGERLQHRLPGRAAGELRRRARCRARSRDRHCADLLRPERRARAPLSGNIAARPRVVRARASRRIAQDRSSRNRSARLCDRRSRARGARKRHHRVGHGRRVLPAGWTPIQLASRERDSVLWIVTNEPQLAFERVVPPAPGEGLVEAAHFPAATIAEELIRARTKLAGQLVAGLAVVFATERLEARKNISPSLTLAMNQLEAGGTQTAHSHNSVAVSLAIEGEGCYSMVDGARKDWAPYVTMVTPPTSVHSHHNRGERAGHLVDRPGWRPLLPLPHHGLPLRVKGGFRFE